MKHRLAAMAILVALVLTLTGCSGLLLPSLNGGGSDDGADGGAASGALGELRILTGAIDASSLMPDTSASFTGYAVTLNRDGAEAITGSFDASNGELAMETVPEGSWAVTVAGLVGDSVIGRGTATVDVVAGEVATISVNLTPLTDGAGTLALELRWPEGAADAVAATLEKYAGSAGNPSNNKEDISGGFDLLGGTGARTGASYEGSLSSGSHILRIELRNGGTTVATIVEAVSIFDGLTTAGTVRLSESEIGSAPEPPTAPRITLTENGNLLNWTDVSNTNESYQLQRKHSGWQTIANLGPTTTSYDDDVADPETQEYRIRAVNDYGPDGAEAGWVEFPTYAFLDEQDDLGVSSSDNITSETSLRFYGSVAPGTPVGTTVRLTAESGGQTQSSTYEVDAGDVPGEWSISIDLTEGSWELRVDFLDATDTVIARAEGVPVTVDTTSPSEAPTLLRPRVGFNTGADLTPQFKWAALADGARVEIQADDDPDFSSPEYEWSGLTGTSFEPPSDMAASSTVPVGTRYYLRVRALDVAGNATAWTKDESGAAPHRYVNVGRFDGDFNGDGHSDILVGDYYYDPTSTTENENIGRAYLFHGADRGSFDTTADFIVDGKAGGSGSASGRLGLRLGFVGDVNADGYQDFLVSAISWGSTEEGEAYLFLGGDSRSGTVSASTADLVITNPTASSSPTIGRFGWGVSGAGDVNADGYADFLLGAYRGFTSTQSGGYPSYVGLYLGDGNPDATPDAEMEVADSGSFTSNYVNEHFAIHHGPAGDLNGDGLDDLLVGTNIDEVRLYLGARDFTPGSPEVTFVAPSDVDDGRRFGNTLAPIGDLNGDGIDDLVIGAKSYEGSSSLFGRAAIYYGRENFGSSVTSYDRSATGLAQNSYLASALGSPGDVDGDGKNDLLIGEWGRARGRFFFGTNGPLAADYNIDPGSPIDRRFGMGVGRGW